MENKIPAKRIASQDFVRAILCIAMVIYHYSMNLSVDAAFFPLKQHATGLWGDVIVTVFFAMSGAMLYKNNAKIDSFKLCRQYIFKRWKSIFPLFYTVFFLMFINNVLNAGSFFYRGNPFSLLLSLVGLDGYLTIYGVSTYYICGEWFLGALIILYVLYPIILYFFNKNSIIVSLVVLVYYLFKQFTGIGVHLMFADIFSCLFSFVIGMLFMKYNLFDNKSCVVTAWIIAVFTLIVELPGSPYFWNHISGLSLYLALNSLGKKICTNHFASGIVLKISKLSFSIYLVHHLLIAHVVRSFNPMDTIQVISYLLVVLLLSFLYGWMASLISSHAVKSFTCLFQKRKKLNVCE